MADKTVIIKLDVQEAGAEAQIVSLNNKLSKLTAGERDYELVLKKIAIQEDKLSRIQAKRAVVQGSVLKETKNTTRVLNKQSDATGSATAATMELSRVVSDAPYGIRGMANNITQLVSQLGTASTKAGGLTAALKLMGKQLMGPLGIVFAITAVVSALDFFFGANTKAEKSLDGFRKTAAGAAGDLTSLLIVMKEDMLSKEELSSVIDKVNEKYKDLNLSIGEEGKLTKESVTQIDDKIAALGKLAMANAMLSEIQNKRGETAKAAVELQDETSEDLKKLGLASIADFRDIEVQRTDETKQEYIKRKNSLLSTQEGTYKGLVDVDRIGRFNSIKRQVADFDETKKRVSNQVKELLKLSTDEGFFEDFFSSKGKEGREGSKLSKLIDPKEFEGDIFTVEEMLRKFSGQELLRSAKTAEDKRTAQAIIELEGFKNSYEGFKEGEDRKFDKFKENLEKKRLAEIEKAIKNKSSISDVNDKFDKALLDAQDKYEAESTISYTEYVKGIKSIADKNKPELIGDELATPQYEKDKIIEDSKAKHLNFMLGKYVSYAEDVNSVMSEMSDFANAEFDRELVIEQNKTNSLNNELNNRLQNENLSKEQRQSIQNQIAQNDEKLRVKQEQIERKRFKMQKAVDISTTIMNTAVAMMKALKIYGPTPAGFIAAGVAAAQGAVQVATIARQKFQTSSGNSPRQATGSDGGGGSGRAEPSFNIVGRSNDNILLSAIQSQFDQPLRAYVVARDVTNQQQLDGVISTSAST